MPLYTRARVCVAFVSDRLTEGQSVASEENNREFNANRGAKLDFVINSNTLSAAN